MHRTWRIIAKNQKNWNEVYRDSLHRLGSQGFPPAEVEALAEIFATERITAQLHRNGVLFLCGHNAGRSQMSQAWFNHRMSLRKNVDPAKLPLAFSAGSNPSNRINEIAKQAMSELGIELSQSFPKPWTTDVVNNVQAVISMGCKDSCPTAPGTTSRDWSLTDPHGQDIDAVRKVRNSIIILVDQFIEEKYPLQ